MTARGAFCRMLCFLDLFRRWMTVCLGNSLTNNTLSRAFEVVRVVQ